MRAEPVGFDPNGSTTADGINTYGYDTRGRMAQATSSLGVTPCQVNALGQRVYKRNAFGGALRPRRASDRRPARSQR